MFFLKKFYASFFEFTHLLTHRYVPTDMEAYPYTNLYRNAYSSIIHNSSQIETTQKRPVSAEWTNTMSCSLWWNIILQ